MTEKQSRPFQSPSGDSLFSDSWKRFPRCHISSTFQSPSGDSLFSDERKKIMNALTTTTVSIP